MKIISLFLVAFGSLLSVIQAQPLMTDDMVRSRIADQYLTCAQWLARSVQLEEVTKVVDFLSENSILAKPSGENVMVISPSKGDSQNQFLLIVLTTKDESEADAVWRKRSKDQSFIASFDPGNRGLIIKANQQLSPFCKGIIFFHEGMHAQRFITAPYDWRDSITFFKKELEAHELQNKVYATFGGPEYQKIVHTEVSRIEMILALSAGDLSKITPPPSYDTRMDALFGPSVSEWDQNMRMAQIWVHGMLKVAERRMLTSREPIELTKIKYLRAIYESQSIHR